MTASTGGDIGGGSARFLHSVIAAALDAGSRDAFTALLTEDVHWDCGDECTDREQAGDHYAGLLATGLALHLADLQSAEGSGGEEQLVARLQIRTANPDSFPSQLTVRLTLREGLVADICELDPPPTIEVLYVDGCPNHDQFLPHLTAVLAAHHITAALTLIRIDDDDDARQHRFLGSPTVRVNGRDVEPSVAALEVHQADRQGTGDATDPANRYGLQCRLYRTADGEISGTPRDEWIIDALVGDPVHDAATGGPGQDS